MGTTTRAGTGQKLADRLLLNKVTRMTSSNVRGRMINFLFSDASSVVASDESKAQSLPGAPGVMIRDLQKTHGDSVECSLNHNIRGKPIMGQQKAEGKEKSLTRSTFKIMIDKYRQVVDEGDTMTDQRLGFSLTAVGKEALSTYWGELKTQLTWVHLAGARGDYVDEDVHLDPVEPDVDGNALQREQAEILVNPLMPPSANRRFFGGGKTKIDDMTEQDKMDLETIYNFSMANKENANPLGTIDLSTADKPMQTDPFNLILVTPRQWRTLQESAGTSYNQLVAQATRRAAGFDHHLFKGDCMFIENMLIRQYFMPTRFMSGSTVKGRNDDVTGSIFSETVPNNVVIDRALVLGRQAFAMAIGHTVPGLTFKLFRESFDGDDSHRSFLTWMAGIRKITVDDSNRKPYDLGVATIDTAVDLAA